MNNTVIFKWAYVEFLMLKRMGTFHFAQNYIGQNKRYKKLTSIQNSYISNIFIFKTDVDRLSGKSEAVFAFSWAIIRILYQSLEKALLRKLPDFTFLLLSMISANLRGVF